MKKLNHVFLACFLGLCITSCSHAQQQQEKETFRLPDVPDMLATPEERASYLSLHYWDHFAFSDTTMISKPEITEQAFVDFLSILPYSDQAPAAVDTLFRRAAIGQEMLYYFIELSDKYLYEPNSPMHNEDLHILVLRALLGNPCLSDADKIRPRYLLEMAMKNRPGDVAADFTVVCRDGQKLSLSQVRSPYLLLYFNDPECEDCRRVRECLASSTIVNGLLDAGRLKVLSVCVEGKTAAWEKVAYPARWIDTCDEDQRLTRELVYDLKAMPTLYLLDAERRVVLKDTSVAEIEAFLSGEAGD